MKNIYQKGWDRINEMSKVKKFYISLGLLMLSQLVPYIFLSESYILNNSLLQNFISYISSFVPGVQKLSDVTQNYKNTLALQLSIFWVEVPMTVFLTIFYGIQTKPLKSEEDKIKMYFASFFGFILFAWGIWMLYKGIWFDNPSRLNKKMIRMIDGGYGLVIYDLLLITLIVLLSVTIVTPKTKLKVEGENND